MVEKLTQEKVWQFIEMGDEDFDLEGLRSRHKIDAESSAFYTAINRLMSDRKIKRLGRGKYRRVKKIEPVNWWNDDISEEPLNFIFPRSHEDGSKFGIEDIVEIFPGDAILIDGPSNFGKTVIALSIMGENLGLMPCYLMGSEYTASNGKISPKFKRRMRRMSWANWMDDGKPNFQLYPVGSDYEDFIQPDALNIVDWISLPGEYYLIDAVMKSMKDRVGNGILVGVLQKNKGADNPEGGERAERYADVHLKIDPYGHESMITLGKVKAPKGRASGRRWGFDIVDFGANLHNIREIVKCSSCYGKGWVRFGNSSKPCESCRKTGYVDK